MCTVRATLAKYEAMAQAGKAAAAIPLAEPSAPAPSKSSKKKKKKSTAASSAAIPLTTITPDLAQASTQRAIERLRNMVSSGVPALDMAGITFDKVCTTSLRATSIARAPRVLRFHFVRSEYTPYGQLLKKTARVHFPPTLQLDAYMERGVLEPPNARVPTVASLLGGKATAVAEAATSATIGAAAAAAAAAPARTRTLYRLHSAILHHGYTHSSGHFVALRRKPDAPPNIPGKGWLRISDADVEEVGIESLVDASAQVFMLFYEREDAGDVVYAAHADVEEYETSTPGEVDDVDGINYTAHNFIDTTTTSASPSAWPTYPPSQTLHTLGLPSDPFRPKNGSPRKSLFDLE
jgi:ubiquitin carboxyl-terminal hydrolase 1